MGVVFAAETGFRLERNPDTVLAPDAGFFAKRRVPEGQLPKEYFPGLPDLAVEVVSPEDRASEAQETVQDWLSFGVALVWIVEPKTRMVTVYRSWSTAPMATSPFSMHRQRSMVKMYCRVSSSPYGHFFDDRLLEERIQLGD